MAIHSDTGTARETGARLQLAGAEQPEQAADSRYSLAFVRAMLTEGPRGAVASFRELSLRSAFQPIFSLPHKRAIGFDASVRSANARGEPLAVEALFETGHAPDTALLDMLCSALHLHNFYSFHRQQGWMFLNLHPAVFLDSQSTSEFLGQLLRHSRVPAGRLVIDVHDSVLDSAHLCSALEDYRRIGCLIAIDDFGLDHHNLDSIRDCNATLVKMAPSVIAEAAVDRGARQALIPAVSLLHEMGVLVQMEGVENEVQALLAIDADADFASGFYFGDTAESLDEHAGPSPVLEALWSTYKQKRNWSQRKESQPRASLHGETLRSSQIRKLGQAPQEEIRRYRECRRPFLTALRHVANRMSADMPFEIACQEFLQLPGAIRCYLLDAQGRQFGRDMPAYRRPAPQGVDFHEQAVPAASEWCRRDFFRRALNEPDVVQATRQYCSLTGHTTCVTFSIAITANGKPFVLCADVDWSRIANAAR